jgi:hypothetical protein
MIEVQDDHVSFAGIDARMFNKIGFQLLPDDLLAIELPQARASQLSTPSLLVVVRLISCDALLAYGLPTGSAPSMEHLEGQPFPAPPTRLGFDSTRLNS